MRVLKDHKGFSLVELIVVIAIIGILAGSAITLMGHIAVANVDKSVQTFTMAMNKLQLDSMSKSDKDNKSCIFLFRSGNTYYICRAKKSDAFNLNTMKANGTSLGSNIKVSTHRTFISGLQDSPVELVDGDYLKLAYLRDGSLDTEDISLGSGNDLLTLHITLEGKGGSEIIINKDTGKLIVQ